MPDGKLEGAHRWLVCIGVALILAAVALDLGGALAGTTVTKVGTTTTTTAWPSDTQIATILAAGALLVLTGFLWTRITTIKLPGGGELDLTRDEKETVAAKVADAVDGQLDPKQVAEVALDTASTLRATKAGPTKLGEAEIARVVESKLTHRGP
jgi:hypothetical protein